MRKPVESDFQWVKPDGRPTQYFFELIKSLSDSSLPSPVSNIPPTNGQFLVYNTATSRWALQPTTPPTNGQVMIYNSGTGTWVAGTN